MFRTVSVVVAAASLLAVPASAAVMQAVFTGYETFREYEEVEYLYDEDGNRNLEKYDRNYDQYRRTPVTWTLQYTTNPDPETGGLSEKSSDHSGSRYDQWELSGSGIIISSVL